MLKPGIYTAKIKDIKYIARRSKDKKGVVEITLEIIDDDHKLLLIDRIRLEK